MKDLNKRALGGLLNLLISLAALLFLPAWTIDYWQAWVFLVLFSGSVLAITLYLMKHDPKLLQRRVTGGPAAEHQKSQKVIQSLAAIAFIGMFVLAAIDHRFTWSAAPPSVVAAGDILVALGLLIVFFVFKENTFASAIIEIGSDQKLVSTGLYAFVRHPMYLGGLVMVLGVPFALGSWWALFAIIPFALVIVLRLLDEEKFLAKNLAGYSEYRSHVRHRLVPFIW